MSEQEPDYGKGVPYWSPEDVTATCSEGPKKVPAFVHDWCPGLAVTMFEFGQFNITHIASGLNVGGRWQRADSAMLEMVEWSAIARSLDLSWSCDPGAVVDGIRAARETPVPFSGATVTGAGETRPMTIREWVKAVRGSMPIDEFPWEGEDAPGERAFHLLVTLNPLGSSTEQPPFEPASL